MSHVKIEQGHHGVLRAEKVMADGRRVDLGVLAVSRDFPLRTRVSVAVRAHLRLRWMKYRGVI